MILSFAWTTPALLEGRKTVTRRNWKRGHPGAAYNMCLGYGYGKRIHQAWSKMPYAGGHRVGYVELTCKPYWEKLSDMPESDLAAEGGLWDSLDEFIELMGGDPDKEVLVIRFKWLGRVRG